MSLRAAFFAGLAALPLAAHAEPVDGLEWSWADGETRRWYVETEVTLPSFLWLMKDKNKEARLVAFQMRSIISCGDAEEAGRKAWQYYCTIDDIGITGAVLRGDRELLQPILEEMDDKLTGARLQISQKRDGRITLVDLEDVEKDNRREARMHEAMRIMLVRSIAGFDLQLPRKGVSEEGVWGQYQALLLAAPTDAGTQGSAEVAHLVRRVEDDYVFIETAGKAMISPATDSAARNFYETRLEGVTVFDAGTGHLKERVWTALGEPTASSAVADAGAGVPYLQRGRIVYLAEGATAPEVGETAEVAAPGDAADSAIGPWVPLGGEPPR